MKYIKLTFFSTILFSLSAFTLIKLVNWKVKDEYSVKYSWPHPSNNGQVITVEGSFTGLKATILFDEKNPEKSKISASVDAATINTGNGVFNSNKSAKEALDTGRFPLITFVSTHIKKNNNAYEATGNLTIKGITKKIIFPFTFDTKGTPGRFPFFPTETFSGGFTIVPKEFNIIKEGIPQLIRVDLKIPVTE